MLDLVLDRTQHRARQHDLCPAVGGSARGALESAPPPPNGRVNKHGVPGVRVRRSVRL